MCINWNFPSWQGQGVEGFSELLTNLRVNESFIMPLKALMGGMAVMPAFTTEGDRQMILMREGVVMGYMDITSCSQRLQRPRNGNIVFPTAFAGCMSPSSSGPGEHPQMRKERPDQVPAGIG